MMEKKKKSEAWTRKMKPGTTSLGDSPRVANGGSTEAAAEKKKVHAGIRPLHNIIKAFKQYWNNNHNHITHVCSTSGPKQLEP